MSDIFLSYSRKDEKTARALAGALSRLGWTVWWDRRIPAGRDYADVIKEALDETRCAIVLWSKNSTAPKSWVRKEATYAENRGVIVPVLIEEVEIPFEFQRIHAADLIGWEGDASHEGFSTLVGDLTSLLGAPGAGEGGDEPASVKTAPTGSPPAAGAAGEEASADETTPPPVRPPAEARRTDASGAGALGRVDEPDEAGPGRSQPVVSMITRLPSVLKVAVGAAVLVGLIFIVVRWGFLSGRDSDNLNGRQSNMRSPTPRPSPSITPGPPGNGNVSPSPPDNRAPDPERVRRLAQLFRELNAGDERTRRTATDALKNRYASDPQAVEQALGLLDESKVGALSPQALVNVLFFLNIATDEAWTVDSYRKAQATLQRLEGMELGSQARGQLGKLKVSLMLLPGVKRNKGDATWGL